MTGSKPSLTTAELGHQLQKAVSSLEAGDVDQARQVCDTLIKQYPDHSAPLHLLGMLELTTGDTEAAITLLQQAANLAPTHQKIRQHLSVAYRQAGLWDQAITSYRALLELMPANPQTLLDLGFCLQHKGDLDGAIQFFSKALDIPGDHAFTAHHALALAFNQRGDGTRAILSYEQAVKLKPSDPDLIADLATLYEQANRIEDAHGAVQRGLALVPTHDTLNLVAAKCARRAGKFAQAIDILKRIAGTVNEARIERAFEFELGRNYDKLNETITAYSHYVRANELTFTAWPNIEAPARSYLNMLDVLSQAYTTAWVKNWRTLTVSIQDADPAPVFLVGFPRSGTTLLDTILGAHPDIEILEEIPAIDELVNLTNDLPGGYPAALADIDDDSLLQLQQHYRNRIQAQSKPHPRRIFIDKLPINTVHVGLIKRVFPHSRFIFSLRHPCDVCLSCFMQEFGPSAMYANFCSLEQSTVIYSKVMRLWQQYTSLFPLDIHYIRYEDLVANKHDTIQALLDFLGLDWHPDLDDHTAHAANRGRIYTPSYHQVIQPIYSDALFRWHKYRARMLPVIAQLAPFIETFGYQSED